MNYAVKNYINELKRKRHDCCGRKKQASSGNSELLEGTNENLRYLAEVWKVDGDLMRCVGCNRGIIASRKHERPIHADGCPKDGYMDNKNPWQILKDYLAL